MVNIHHGGTHRGVDLSDGENTPLYSIVDGIITNKGYDADGYGNYIVMKDNSTEQGFLYGHMKESSPLNVGDNVIIGTYVGIEGSTGNSTGNHVHVESQDMTNQTSWTFNLPLSQCLNPTLYMDFPNETGTKVYYYGTPSPPPPPPPPPRPPVPPVETTGNKWKWQKLRNFKIIY